MITHEQYKSLTKINTWKSLWDITLCWTSVGSCLYICHLSLWFLPLCALVIATRLHALTVMMHDGSHYLLHKNKMVNDIISNLFCSFPLQISTEAYRQTHERHHQHTQTMKDPNYVIMRREEAWRFPKPKAEVKKLLVQDLFLMTIKDHMIILKDWQVLPNFKKITKLEQFIFPIFILTVLGVTAWQGLWKEFFILQGSALFINPLVRIRAMSEHVHHEASGQGKIHKLQETTTINANLIERFFIAPLNTNRHLEHHTYPTVPYFNLEKLHKLIRSSVLYKANCAYELDGYLMGKRNSFNLVLSQSEMDEEVTINVKAA